MLKKLREKKRKIRDSELIKHETKRNILLRFLFVLGIFLVYFIYINFHYEVKESFFVTLLTWSFFMFCTPIADAGLLLDFPIRLITKIRMSLIEIFVWGLALLVNIIALLFKPEIYQTTEILRLFKHIIKC